MATGDVKVAVTSVSALGTLTVQPSSGERWLVTEMGTGINAGENWGSGGDDGENTANIYAYLYDGTNRGIVYYTSRQSWGITCTMFGLMLDNGLYLRITSNYNATCYLSYCGVQL